LLAEAYPAEADVVIGVPDSGLDAALGYAQASAFPTASG
jgi:amidophosphoribosyltransferase